MDSRRHHCLARRRLAIPYNPPRLHVARRSCWECLLTCFFIDTAKDITEYIRLIKTLLTPGGAWVNIGPLLWHFSDTPKEYSLDLTWEEVRALIVDAGFVFERETWHTCPYVRNTKSMYRSTLRCL